MRNWPMARSGSRSVSRSWSLARRGLALVAGAMVLALAVRWGPELARSVRTHPYFRVDSLELEGNRRVSRAELVAWIQWKDGTSIWDVNPEALRERLVQHPWVRGGSVHRMFPRRLRIYVRERRPVALLQGRGSFQYIDRTGKVLGPLLPGETPNLPVISGIDEFAQQELSSLNVHRALKLLHICERLRCFDDVSQIHIGRRGLVAIPMRSRVAVVLGWGNFERKLERSARIFAAWETRPDRLLQVDLTLPNMAVVKIASPEPQPKGRGKRRTGRAEA